MKDCDEVGAETFLGVDLRGLVEDLRGLVEVGMELVEDLRGLVEEVVGDLKESVEGGSDLVAAEKLL